MKFMLLVKADKSSDEGVMPTKEELVAMGKYNEELVKAGILLAADGLHPTSAGARVGFSGGNSTVTDGPFTETKELIAGYWVIQAKFPSRTARSRFARSWMSTTSATRPLPRSGRLSGDCAPRWPNSSSRPPNRAGAGRPADLPVHAGGASGRTFRTGGPSCSAAGAQFHSDSRDRTGGRCTGRYLQ
jgi:hypothetical protein